jgi:hypothetical protein
MLGREIRVSWWIVMDGGCWMGADSVESSVKISSVSFLWTSCVHSDGSAVGTEQAD